MSTIITLLTLLILSIFFQFYLNKNKRQSVKNGKQGEAKVKKILVKYCKKHKHSYVLNHVTLRLKDRTTTQIDHILITRKGIFVIETKHYNGWVFACAKSKFWMQTFYKKKYKFQNPILQNYRHVKAIQAVFPFIKYQFIHNIVVFSGNAKFKTSKPQNVFHLEELLPAIKAYSTPTLSAEQIHYAVKHLEAVRLKSTKKTDIEHQMYLARKFS